MNPTNTADNARGPHNTPCQHCHQIHVSPCPYVKAYEYHPDGSLKRIEFHPTQPITSTTWELGKGIDWEQRYGD